MQHCRVSHSGGGVPVLRLGAPFRLTGNSRLVVRGVDRQNEVTRLRPPSWPLKYDILCTGCREKKSLLLVQARKSVSLTLKEKVLEEHTMSEQRS